MTFVVRKHIHSSSGKLRYVKQEASDFSRHLTADGSSLSHLDLKSLKNSTAFLREEA
jgi:hypothetical protein